MDTIIELGETTFAKEVLEADTPVLVDFYASWCGPSQILASLLDGLAGEFADRVKFVRVNLNDAPELAKRFGITTAPTIIFFCKSLIVGTIPGLIPPAQLKTRLDEVAALGRLPTTSLDVKAA
jgi:thioredoxin 1